MVKILLPVFILFTAFACNGQDMLFTVVAKYGSVEKTSPGASAWDAVKTGEKIFKGEKLRLSGKDYIALMSTEGNTVELNKQGVFDAAKLYNNNGTRNAIASKISGFVTREIINASYNKEMKMVGAVVRQSKNQIETTFPKETVICDSIITFRWYSIKDIQHYIFRLINPEGKLVFMAEAADTLLILNLNNLSLKPNNCYLWFIHNSEGLDASSDSSCIIIPPINFARAIIDTTEQITGNGTAAASALQAVTLAVFFERNRMMLSAMDQYEKTINLMPEVLDYKKKYLSFLIDAGLFRKAQIIYQMIDFE